jgi:hypothetical protein
MLAKLKQLKQTPPKVLLATLLLLVLFVAVLWFIPPLALSIVVGLATAWSVFTLLNYWIG